MKHKSKRAMTLVEMVVSIGLIALISVALLGILMPVVSMQKNSKKVNTATYEMSGELESALFNVKNGMPITPGYITVKPHTLGYTLNGKAFTASGQLIEAKDTKSDVTLYAFNPTAKVGG
ncbi:MAG: type II secretion system protein [Christensenella sp.]